MTSQIRTKEKAVCKEKAGLKYVPEYENETKRLRNNMLETTV